MQTTTTVLPTARAIRAALSQQKYSNAFLPRYITMGEFLQRSIHIEGYRRVDNDTRTLLLMEAAAFENFSKLQIERNFFTFTHNSSYLFRFFEELSGELIDIGTLTLADTYGDYEEHISILTELYQRYETLCDERKVLDPIFAPKHYRINEAYVKSLGNVIIHAEGYLTNFELKLISQIAEITPVELMLEANQYNMKLQRKLSQRGVIVEKFGHYRIDFSGRSVIEHAAEPSPIQITAHAFSERMLQIGFIKKKVYDYVQAGIAPEKIAVVVPDENFAEHLKLFDTEENFNFAMGFSLRSTRTLTILQAAYDYLDNSSMENRARIMRVAPEFIETLRPHFQSVMSPEVLMEILAELIAGEPKSDAREIMDEELYLFDKLLPALSGVSFKSALYLFINRLTQRSLDDVRGGKVTVMGVLETRAVELDGVIVVDFNEGVVPRKSEKDLFLNSSTRKNAGLPDAQERESLQKLYYHNLFSRAKQVAISCVKAADSVPSRFLTQLDVNVEEVSDETQWAPILFKVGSRIVHERQPISAAYDFTARPLSSTALSMFLACRRKFYHRYVQKLTPHEIIQDMPKEYEIGNALHHALRDVYRKTPAFDDAEELAKALQQALHFHNGASVLDKFLMKLWMKKLSPFIAHEIKRFENARVVSCEEGFAANVEGITITGQIDRIDQCGEHLEVLDYKSGKYKTYTSKTVEKADDFQLQFYYLLAGQKGQVERCGFYDLNRGEIVYESVMEEKLERLKAHLRSLAATKTYEFDQTDDIKQCHYCDYRYICQRGL